MGELLADTNSCSVTGSVASAAGPIIELSVGTLRQARMLWPSFIATLSFHIPPLTVNTLLERQSVEI